MYVGGGRQEQGQPCRNVQLPTQAERGLLDRPHLSCIPRNLFKKWPILLDLCPGLPKFGLSKGTLLPSLLATSACRGRLKA